jgi:hypothetical protein
MTRIPKQRAMQQLHAESRRKEVIRMTAENVPLTEQAKELGVSYITVKRDRKVIMELVKHETKTEMQVYREAQLTRIAEKWDEIENDDTMTGAEKHLAWSRWMKLEMDLRGTAAPSKSIVGHVTGPQLDALYLDIRQELIDLDDDAKHEALLMMREFAKSRKKPVVVTAKLLDGGTDVNFS